GGAVRVDIVDSGSLQIGVLQGIAHAAERAVAVLARRGHVEGICRDAVAGQLAVNPRPPRPGVLVLLEHHGAGALAQHEAVALLVPRTARSGRVVVARGKRPARGEIDADALAVLRRHLHAGVAPGLQARRHAVVDEEVHAARFLRRQVRRHVELLHLAGDLAREPRRIEARDAGDAGLPGEGAI